MALSVQYPHLDRYFDPLNSKTSCLPKFLYSEIYLLIPAYFIYVSWLFASPFSKVWHRIQLLIIIIVVIYGISNFPK